ncbi:GNAT family N-acetyltransferase [bacterium]|nr:MAG: GNAT family N-acetyltransferase [bacterium]
MIIIRPIEQGEADSWNQFVSDHSQGALTHLHEWGLAANIAYGLEVEYLGAFDDGEFIAMLPAIVIKRPFAPRIAVSLAFCHYSGWLIAKKANETIVRRMFVEFLDAQGIHKLELRQKGGPEQTAPGEVTLIRPLERTSEVLWEALDAKVRNQVRKATNSGLTPRWGKDQFEEFYSVYARNTSFLGSPVHSKTYFRILLEKLPAYTEILTIRLEGNVVAAMFLTGYKGQLSDPWAASLRQYDKLCPNMLMYWEAFRFGCQNSYSSFDMGRSQLGSTTFRFKRQWGTHALPLHYSSISLNGTSDRTSTNVYRSSQAHIVSRIWRALPLPLATWLGPKIRKYIP